MTDPLFDPDRQEACSLPSTPAVRFQFVSDCLILPAPAPIFDCPDIDIAPDPPPPRPSFITISNIITEDLDLGPGADGEDCVPTDTDNCVIWVWCDCGSDSSSNSLSDSAASTPSVGSSAASEEDAECPVYQCEDASSGQWVNMATGAPWTPADGPGPCHAGRMFGEAMKICDCPTVPCPICAYYALDEAGGGATDSTDTTPLTPGATDPASVSGLISTARGFDGVYDRLEADSTDCFSLADGGTVWGWVRYELTTTNGPGHFIAGKAQSFSVDREWIIVNDISPESLSHRGGIQGGVLDVSGILYVTPEIQLGPSGESVQDNWFFVALWANPVTLELGLRVNNTVESYLISEYGGTAFDTTNDGFAMGGWHTNQSIGGWGAFIGELDEWGFADCVLTAAQLDALYNSGAGVDYTTAQTIVF